MLEISPDFEEHDNFISIKQSFLDRNQIKFKHIRKKYKIKKDYSLEEKITGAYAQYVQENKVISARARKVTSKSIQHITGLSADLINSTEQLNWETKAFLIDRFWKSGTSQEDFIDHLKKANKAYQLAAQDLLANIQNNREKLIVEDRLAAHLTEIFCEISDEEPIIYTNSYYDRQKNDSRQYVGTLAIFLYLIEDLFQPFPRLNILTRAAKLRQKGTIKSNHKK